jgi:hypothetical protein
MNRRLNETLGRWLRHERVGDDKEAETALSELLTALSTVEVPAGFADRVLTASGVATAVPRTWFKAKPWIWRSVFGVWAVTSFLAVVAVAGFLVDLSRSSQSVELASRLVVGLSRFGAELMIAVNGLLRAAAAVSAAFSGPATLAVVLACAFASLMALRALTSLLESERSSRHVESY